MGAAQAVPAVRLARGGPAPRARARARSSRAARAHVRGLAERHARPSRTEPGRRRARGGRRSVVGVHPLRLGDGIPAGGSARGRLRRGACGARSSPGDRSRTAWSTSGCRRFASATSAATTRPSRACGVRPISRKALHSWSGSTCAGWHSPADGRRRLRPVPSPSQQAQREYVGPAAMLMTIALDVDDEAAAAAMIQANVDAMTGPMTIATTVVRELIPLLDHPRLGPLIRRLTLWAARSEAAAAEPRG